MVVAAHWWGVLGFAFAMTVAWLFVEKRVTTTALLAGAAWSFAALTGGNVTRYTDAGDPYTVSADFVQYLAMLLALLSFLVLILYRLGVYPPEEDDPYSGDSR